MMGLSHWVVNGSLAYTLTGNVWLTLGAMATATLPDLLEKVLLFIPHRGPTHWLALWVGLTAWAVLGLGLEPGHLFLLGCAAGGLGHVLADALSEEGIPLGPFAPKWGLRLYKTGALSEGLVVAGVLASCGGWIWLFPEKYAGLHSVLQGVIS